MRCHGEKANCDLAISTSNIYASVDDDVEAKEAFGDFVLLKTLAELATVVGVVTHPRAPSTSLVDIPQNLSLLLSLNI
jgi:hypothetical protein